jgi:hypothetical protein
LKAIKSTDEGLKEKYFKRLEDQKAQHPNAAVLIQLRSKLNPTLESISKELLQSRFKNLKTHLKVNTIIFFKA